MNEKLQTRVIRAQLSFTLGKKRFLVQYFDAPRKKSPLKLGAGEQGSNIRSPIFKRESDLQYRDEENVCLTGERSLSGLCALTPNNLCAQITLVRTETKACKLIDFSHKSNKVNLDLKSNN